MKTVPTGWSEVAGGEMVPARKEKKKDGCQSHPPSRQAPECFTSDVFTE